MSDPVVPPAKLNALWCPACSALVDNKHECPTLKSIAAAPVVPAERPHPSPIFEPTGANHVFLVWDKTRACWAGDCGVENDRSLETYALDEFRDANLVYCDMEGWALQDDGGLLLVDECGNFAYADHERYEVRFNPEFLAAHDLRGTNRWRERAEKAEAVAASAADRVSALTSLVERWREEAPRWPPQQFDGDVYAKCADELAALLDPAERPAPDPKSSK